MDSIPPRVASLVLVTRDSRVLGRLPAIPIATPWWQETGPVVSAAREHFGLEVIVLRLLATERPRPHGGAVTYLGEVREPLPDPTTIGLTPWSGVLDEDALRMPWARPGGPDADVEWAERVLRDRGIERAGSAEQYRAWNLSSIWRLPLTGAEEPGDGSAAAWLKVVPPFFAHEGDVLRRLQGGPVPRLIGTDRVRILLAGIAGSDRYDATPSELFEMVSRLVAIQAGWIGRLVELTAIGLPDWRGPALTAAIQHVVEARAAEIDPDDLPVLRAFVAGLPQRFASIEACGIPDTLVHGDFHPGNVRGIAGEASSLVLLDWGDTGIGNPLLDLPAFLAMTPADERDRIHDHWIGEWRAAVPGADPASAATLIAPIAAARQAVIYQGFVDRIEPSERPFHDADVPDWLTRTAALLRD